MHSRRLSPPPPRIVLDKEGRYVIGVGSLAMTAAAWSVNAWGRGRGVLQGQGQEIRFLHKETIVSGDHVGHQDQF